MNRYHAPLFIIGTSAERGGIAIARLPIGSRFYETDTNDMYTWQGAWYQLVGGGGMQPNQDYTISGLFTYDRDPVAPFAVSAGSAQVANLDVDQLDGYEASDLLSLVWIGW